MEKYLRKKLRTAKILRIITWLILPGIFSIALMPAILPVIFPILVAMCACAYFYIFIYRRIFRNLRWLERKGLFDNADDIAPDKSTFPVSRISCGQKAMFFRRASFAVIPYEEITKIRRCRREVQKTIIGTVITEHLEIETKDGTKFPVSVDSGELKPLIEQYILTHTTNLAAVSDTDAGSQD